MPNTALKGNLHPISRYRPPIDLQSYTPRPSKYVSHHSLCPFSLTIKPVFVSWYATRKIYTLFVPGSPRPTSSSESNDPEINGRSRMYSMSCIHSTMTREPNKSVTVTLIKTKLRAINAKFTNISTYITPPNPNRPPSADDHSPTHHHRLSPHPPHTPLSPTPHCSPQTRNRSSATGPR